MHQIVHAVSDDRSKPHDLGMPDSKADRFQYFCHFWGPINASNVRIRILRIIFPNDKFNYLYQFPHLTRIVQISPHVIPAFQDQNLYHFGPLQL
jgi:hypothetical protein